MPNCVNCSMLNPKQSAKYVCRTGTSASSTARAVTSYKMIRQRTRSTSSLFLTSFRFPTATSGKVDPRSPIREEARGSRVLHRESAQKEMQKREFLSIHDRFIRDARFRKTMIELGRTEEACREMDKLVNEDHTAMTKFGHDQVWPNPSLAKSKFGQIQVWPNPSLAKSKFGQIQVWPKPSLAKTKFGQNQTLCKIFLLHRTPYTLHPTT